MKGDFTRSTFNPEKHYSSVRMQQGRLQLDADWNEQVDIQAHLNQVQIKDLIGISGVPKNNNDKQNYKISPLNPEQSLQLEKQNFKISCLNPQQGYFEISPGQIYVDGILCQLDEKIDNTGEEPKTIPTTYLNQPDYPNALKEDLGQEELQKGDYITYLDVWQRHITSVDDPQIREVALGNVPDTTTRTKTVWQVKLLKLTNNNVEEKEEEFLQRAQQEWKTFLQRKKKDNIFLTPKVSDGADLENHLYRVEIHQGGKAEEATFKWSRDNGFVVSAIDKIDGNIITLPQNNDEAWQLARPRQWLEIIEIERELAGKPGNLARLQRVSGNELLFDPSSLKNSGEFNIPKQYPTQENQGQQYKIRLWDYTIDTGKAGISVTADNNSEYISLEGEGIEVKFKGEGNYQTGDYWLIPTRKNSGNPLDWPTNGDDSSPYQDLPPHGIKHHYSCLALIKLTNNQKLEVRDCRQTFPSLINCLDDTDFTIDNLQVQGQIPETPGKGTIASNSEDPDDVTVNYFGDDFAELSVGDSIVAQDQARTIQSLDSQSLRLTVNQPFNPVLEESEPGKGQPFSSQKPLVHFSYSSAEPDGAAELIFNSLGLEVKGKIKTTDLELPPQGTFETGTFKGNSLQLGIPQDQNPFSDYGLIQAEEVGGNGQISFTAEDNVRFAFLNGKVVIGEPTNSNELLNVGGNVSANQFKGNGSELTGITAQQVGAIANINNATPTAGKINLVEDGAIAITSVPATNQITISETHSSRTDNPHQVTAEQVGAVSTDGDTITGLLTLLDNLSVNGNVALGTDQATAGFHVQGSEPETALGTISSNHLVTVIGNETTFTPEQQASLLIAAHEIRRITQVLSTTEVIVDLPFSESLSAETFAVVPVQNVTISPSSSSQTTIKINGDIPTELRENDIIIAAGQIRTVLTVTETSNEENINECTIDLPFKEPLSPTTPFAILQPEANITISGWDAENSSWNRAVARVEGAFPSSLDMGDFVIAEGQLRKVDAIDSDNNSFRVTPPFREPLKLGTKVFILSKEEGSISSAISIMGNEEVNFSEIHVGDLLSVGTETTKQTRLITGIINQNELTIDVPFDDTLTNEHFSYQQPIARFTDSKQYTQLIINADGNVGIGTDIPTEKLQVDGSVRVNGDLSYEGKLLQSSSRTLKTDIAELSNQEASQILRELNPIKFNYKKDRVNSLHLGFIAEDVPNLVASSDKKSICPVDIVAVLTKTVQDHQQTLTQLTHLVTQQKHEIVILQEDVTRLSQLLHKKDRAQKRRRFRILAWLKRSWAQVTNTVGKSN